ncbi:MAG: dienelactone hydrolase family protein [Candidatus Omnitrophica bacterium]|nr:dienelactone hydrolase family protein [Candidatus Omnitrophota bacterium]
MGQNYSIITSLQEEARRLSKRRKPLPGSAAAIKKHLNEFEKNYRSCLGDMPLEKFPLKPKVEEKILLDDSNVIQERVVYHSEKLVEVPAHVYYRKDAKGKLPAILLIQGWGLGKWSLQFIKIELAKKGFLVLFPDNRTAGERKMAAWEDQGEQLNVIPAAQCLGKTFMGMNTYDNIRAIDYLSSRKDVDTTRIGVTGLCWGGMQTYNVTALDKRVRCAVCVNSNSTYGATIEHDTSYSYHSCLGTFIPNLLKYGDTVDIYAMIAPRPLLIMNNSNDWWFPISGYQQICREIGRVYKAYNAADKFKHLISSNIHDITGIYEEETLAWFEKHLKQK